MKIKLNGLLIAGLLVVLSNGFVLLNVARNRAGTPVAEFELTERELKLWQQGDDNSGIILQLAYQNGQQMRTYSPKPGRKVFVALEYEGPAWREWRAKQDSQPVQADTVWRQPHSPDQASRLVLIDVSPDAAALRVKYPDTAKVIILPGAAKGGLAGWARVEVSTIHVPLPASRALKGAVHYRVRLRQGPSLEIWVAEVQRIVG